MCVTYVTDSKHVHARRPVHAGMHSSPFGTLQKMDGGLDWRQIQCMCAVDGALMTLNNHQF